MSIRYRLLCAFGFAIFLLLVQAGAQTLFVTQFQSAVSVVTRSVTARDKSYFAADLLDSIRKQLALVMEMDDPSRGAAPVKVAWDELGPATGVALDLSLGLDIDADAIDQARQAYDQTTKEYEAFLKAGEDPDAALERAIFMDDAAGTLKEKL